MPRSRSMSMESSSCSVMSRAETVSVQFHHPVGQRRFAVVDVRDDGEIPDQFVGVCHMLPSRIFSGFIILYPLQECNNEPFTRHGRKRRRKHAPP